MGGLQGSMPKVLLRNSIKRKPLYMLSYYWIFLSNSKTVFDSPFFFFDRQSQLFSQLQNRNTPMFLKGQQWLSLSTSLVIANWCLLTIGAKTGSLSTNLCQAGYPRWRMEDNGTLWWKVTYPLVILEITLWAWSCQLRLCHTHGISCGELRQLRMWTYSVSAFAESERQVTCNK